MILPIVELEPYSEEDRPLLKRANSPEMTDHLGGPENEEQINRRHQRYVESSKTNKGPMFKIMLKPQSEPVGLIGYWERTWRGELIWETGWSVFPEYQGRGIATAATTVLVTRVRQERRHRSIHAFPSVDNLPSNAICRGLGFELIEECDFEYPAGHFMRCNNWCLTLQH